MEGHEIVGENMEDQETDNAKPDRDDDASTVYTEQTTSSQNYENDTRDAVLIGYCEDVLRQVGFIRRLSNVLPTVQKVINDLSVLANRLLVFKPQRLFFTLNHYNHSFRFGIQIN